MHDLPNGLPTRPNSLEEHWMPFTGNRDFKDNPRLVVQSEGVYCWDHKGGKLIDGSSALLSSCILARKPIRKYGNDNLFLEIHSK